MAPSDGSNAEKKSKSMSTRWCYSEKDEGPMQMYRGHQRAKGQFVNYLNSDDYFSRNDAVEIAVTEQLIGAWDWFFLMV